MKKKTVLVVAFLILLSLSFPANVLADRTSSSSADSSSVSCYSLDVIFVIDQSSTMSDPNYPTDPTNQRQTAVQAMVDWLASNVLDVCPGAHHQVGVISFGSRARIDLPLTEIAPSTMADLTALEKRVDERIVADNLYGTQPIDAFRLIPKMFNDSKISSDGVRKRVIVFLTDGLIGSDYFNDNPPAGFVKPTQELADYINSTFPFDPVLLRREQCISAQVNAYSKLENVPYDRLNKCYSDNVVDDPAYNNSTYLYMVLMNFGQAWPPETKRIYRDVAESHAGEVMDFYNVGSQNRQEIPTYFVTVLSKLTGVPTGQVQCGGVAVNPYLDKAIFSFYKFSPDTKVSLRYTDANGVQHQVVGRKADSPESFHIADYQAYGTNERYIFDNPYPGIWFVESDRCRNGGISAFYQPVLINAGGFTLSLPQLPKYDIPPYYDKSYPTYLTYQMHNDAGVVVNNSDQPLFSVNVKAIVVYPSGKSVDYGLNWSAQEQIFKATEPLQIPEPGTYHVSFTGTIKIHTGDLSTNSEVLSEIFDTDKVLFQNDNLEFTVKDVKPFVVNILKPADKQVLPQIHGSILMGWPLPAMPVPVEVELRGRNGPLDVPATQIMSDPENTFTAWITSADGTTSDTISLKPDPRTPGQFIGEIPWNDSQGRETLHVRLVGSYSSDYAPDALEVQSIFSRQDLNPFYRAEFYKFLLILLIVAIVGGIIYYLWMHTDPVRGTLVVQKNNVTLDRWDVFTGLRISTYKVKDKDKRAERHLRIVWARYAPKVKPTDDDAGTSKARKIVVAGVADCGKKFGFSMESGDTVPFCEDHPDWTIQL